MKKIDDITEQLEQGVAELFSSDRFQEYLDVMTRFYNYSCNNCLLIVMQNPQATYVAGYKAWSEKFHRQVRKGEKAIKILAPIPHKKKIENEDGEEKEIHWNTFRAVSVFDISQTDGEELPEICNDLEGDVNNYDELIQKFEKISPVPVRYEEITTGAHGYFSSADKVIAVCEGMSEQQTIKTLIHEVSHAILHDKDNGTDKEADRNTREVQAESTAYTVCKYLGLDTSEYSFGYIAGWSNGKDTKTLRDSMEKIRITAKQIIEGIEAA